MVRIDYQVGPKSLPAFTPKGELIQLPKGATPIDFAYAVHTDLGDQAVGAKINGRVVPLSTVVPPL